MDIPGKGEHSQQKATFTRKKRGVSQEILERRFRIYRPPGGKKRKAIRMDDFSFWRPRTDSLQLRFAKL